MAHPKVISASDIESVLQTTLSPALRAQCNEANLQYEELTPEERDHYILEVVEELTRRGADDTLRGAGQHRMPDREKGWSEILLAFKRESTIDSLVPPYYGKQQLVRWKQRIIRPLVPYFDYRIHCIVVDWAVETYLSHVDALYEFGCGPAYHLLRARRYNPKARLVGLDWAKSSQDIISEIVASGIEANLEGRHFNLYEPDYSLNFAPNSGILTVAALEQVGERFEPYLHVSVVFPDDSKDLAGAPDGVQLDMTKVKNEFGKTEYVEFDTGLARTIEWQKALYEIQKK